MLTKPPKRGKAQVMPSPPGWARKALQRKLEATLEDYRQLGTLMQPTATATRKEPGFSTFRPSEMRTPGSSFGGDKGSCVAQGPPVCCWLPPRSAAGFFPSLLLSSYWKVVLLKQQAASSGSQQQLSRWRSEQKRPGYDLGCTKNQFLKPPTLSISM